MQGLSYHTVYRATPWVTDPVNKQHKMIVVMVMVMVGVMVMVMVMVMVRVMVIGRGSGGGTIFSLITVVTVVLWL